MIRSRLVFVLFLVVIDLSLALPKMAVADELFCYHTGLVTRNGCRVVRCEHFNSSDWSYSFCEYIW